MDKICPRCKVRLRVGKRSYCRPCATAHQAERRAGLHQRDRLCDVCGEHFEGAGNNTLCPRCRVSHRERQCSRCGITFWARGASLVCPKCQREYSREWLKEEKRRDSRRDKRFGLRPGQWQEMFDAQNGCCKVCSTELKDDRKTVVDHDRDCCDFTARSARPTCGKCTRGLLCWSCNVAIGHAGEDPQRLRAAADYIEAFRRRN